MTPNVEHHISESTKFAFTIGRSVVFAAAIFWAGWNANQKVNEMLRRQERAEQALSSMVTLKDLALMEAKIEKHLLDRFASRNVIASCPVLTVRGQSYKPCLILGLTEPREID